MILVFVGCLTRNKGVRKSKTGEDTSDVFCSAVCLSLRPPLPISQSIPPVYLWQLYCWWHKWRSISSPPLHVSDHSTHLGHSLSPFTYGHTTQCQDQPNLDLTPFDSVDGSSSKLLLLVYHTTRCSNQKDKITNTHYHGNLKSSCLLTFAHIKSYWHQCDTNKLTSTILTAHLTLQTSFKWILSTGTFETCWWTY